MCVVSMVMDHYNDKWDWVQPYVVPPTHFYPIPDTNPLPPITINPLAWGPWDLRFEELKKEIAELRELLKRAKKYDEDNGEPDCENIEKAARIQMVAALVNETIEEI